MFHTILDCWVQFQTNLQSNLSSSDTPDLGIYFFLGIFVPSFSPNFWVSETESFFENKNVEHSCFKGFDNFAVFKWEEESKNNLFPKKRIVKKLVICLYFGRICRIRIEEIRRKEKFVEEWRIFFLTIFSKLLHSSHFFHVSFTLFKS